MFLDQGTAGFTIRHNSTRRPLRFHRVSENFVRQNRWELATPETPPIRFNNTPAENITAEANELLEPEQRVLLIGSSLTWNTLPSRLEGNIHWHVDCGKSLKFIHDSPEEPYIAFARLWPGRPDDDPVRLRLHPAALRDDPGRRRGGDLRID